MGQVSSKLRRFAGGYGHWCPACKEMHVIATDGKNASGAQWSFDGNLTAPTFSPSVNIRTNTPDMPHYQAQACSSVCHYHLRVGRLEYGGDCTHALKGQTVDLPDLPDYLQEK